MVLPYIHMNQPWHIQTLDSALSTNIQLIAGSPSQFSFSFLWFHMLPIICRLLWSPVWFPTVTSICSVGLWFFPFCSIWLLLPDLTYLSSSVQFSRSVVSNSMQPHGLQHARPPCPSETPGVYSNSCPLSQWCHPTISSSVVPFSSHLQSFPALGVFPVSQLFASGGQSIRVSASTSVLPMNTQDWSPLGWTGCSS